MTTVVLPDTIDSTGETDVTAEIRAFLATVPNGCTVRFRPGGRYRVNPGLSGPASDKHDITIDGTGSTLVTESPEPGTFDERTCPTCHRAIVKEAHGGEHPSAGDHDPAFHVGAAYGTKDD